MALLDTLFGQPASHDIRLPARSVRNQGSFDSCFSCAIAAVLEGRALSVPELSPSFHVFYAFDKGGAFGGITLERARATMNVRGMCAQKLYNFDISLGTPPDEPSPEAIADGARRRTSGDADGNPTFARVTGPSRAFAWTRELQKGFPLLVRIWQNAGYLALQANAADPVWNDPEAGGNSHAVAVLGLEAVRERFIVQDSQGLSFGKGGQWYLPFAQSETPAVMDAYVLRVPSERLL